MDPHLRPGVSKNKLFKTTIQKKCSITICTFIFPKCIYPECYLTLDDRSSSSISTDQICSQSSFALSVFMSIMSLTAGGGDSGDSRESVRSIVSWRPGWAEVSGSPWATEGPLYRDSLCFACRVHLHTFSDIPPGHTYMDEPALLYVPAWWCWRWRRQWWAMVPPYALRFFLRTPGHGRNASTRWRNARRRRRKTSSGHVSLSRGASPRRSSTIPSSLRKPNVEEPERPLRRRAGAPVVVDFDAVRPGLVELCMLEPGMLRLGLLVSGMDRA